MNINLTEMTKAYQETAVEAYEMKKKEKADYVQLLRSILLAFAGVDSGDATTPVSVYVKRKSDGKSGVLHIGYRYADAQRMAIMFSSVNKKTHEVSSRSIEGYVFNVPHNVTYDKNGNPDYAMKTAVQTAEGSHTFIAPDKMPEYLATIYEIVKM